MNTEGPPTALAHDASVERAVDLNALRERYRQERDRRLRADGNQQYLEMKAEFSHYIDDPYVEPGFARASRSDQVDVLIIGGGLGGLITAARLREAAVNKILMVEKGGDFGGTWYWNRYPGAQCDIESYIYMPLLEETAYVPSQKYCYGAEIRDHARRIAEKYDLYSKACFQTEVTALRWSSETTRWIVETNRGDAMKARFVLMSSGPLNRPKLPGIPGITTFEGHTFHTSRWDYKYTGGDINGNLSNLSNKSVAIIGTGSTSVQVVPHLARDSGRLYVFQRTPSSVDERRNQPTDLDWAKTLAPGWQMQRMNNFNTLINGGYQEVDLVKDGWTDIFRNLGNLVPRRAEAGKTPEDMELIMELADFKKMNDIRARVDAIVKDKRTAEALKPWYRQFCKRPTFSDEYLPAFNRPNVMLVDTKGRGPDRITPRGIVFEEVEYPVDCIIFSTGFEVGTAYTRRAGLEVYGRNGKTLTEHWSSGFRTLHGFYSHGFPNLFHIGLNQNGWTVNFPHLIHEQARHVVEIINYASMNDLKAIEPTADAEAAWVATIREKALMNRKFLLECTPGFFNNEGRPDKRGAFAEERFGGSAMEFFDIIAKWRADGQMAGLRLT